MLGKDHVTIGLSGGNLIRNSSRDASAWRQQACVFHTRFESGSDRKSRAVNIKN
jgi:hypothetical protein